MDKMKRIFSFVLVFAMLVGSFSSFSTIAFAEEVKKEEVKVEEVKDTEVLSKVPSDVKGTEYEKAVTRLVAFGVIGGYPDGSYKPEEVINRAQFAKIVVVALGLNDAVPAAAHKATGFSDVQPGYWAAGYINVASGQGLLKGYPDGTFKPANQVSYAEALTILVRALGYQDEFLAGRWPGNYVAKAAEVGITKGIKLPTDAANGAKRGPVAQLVDNAFDAKVVKVDTYKPNTGEVEYYETDITLLKDKLEISKYEDTRIIADKIVDDGLEKDELRVQFLKDIDKEDTRAKYSRGEVVKRSYKKGETDKYSFDADFGQPRPVIGEEVTTYINDKDVVVYIERENDDKANFDYVQELDGDKLDLVAFDKSYDFYDNDKEELTANIYVFDDKNDEFKLYNSAKDLKDLDREELVGKMGKVVVKNNKIVYAEILDPAEASPFFVVMKNDNGQLEGINEGINDFKMDLRDDKDYDGVLVYNTKGEKLSVKDIKKGNVLYVQEQKYDGDDVAFVTVVQDNIIEGEMGRVKTDRLEIAGKEIKVVKNDKDGQIARYAINDMDDIKLWDGADSTWEDDMEDAYKEKVVAYKDAVGRIAFLTTEGAGESGYKFGIVTRTYADSDRIRIFTTIDGKEGKDQIFKADKEIDIEDPFILATEDMKDYELGQETKIRLSDSDLKGKQTVLGSAVKFRLNSDGEISKDKLFVMPYGNSTKMEKDEDFRKDMIKAENGNYAVNSDAVNVISAENVYAKPVKDSEGKLVTKGNLDEYKYEGAKKAVDIDDFDVTTWKDIKEDKYDANIEFYVFPKNNKADEVDGLVFIGDKGANTGSDEIAIYALDLWKTGDKLKVEYVTYGSSEKKTAEVDNQDRIVGYKDMKEKAFVAKEKSNGKIELLGVSLKNDDKTEDFEVLRNKEVTAVDGNYVVIKDGRYIASKALIYEEDKTKSVSYLKGKTVDLVIEGNRARVIGVRLDGKTTDTDKPEVAKGEYLVTNEYKANGIQYVTLKDAKGKEIDLQLGKEDKDLGKGAVIKDITVKKQQGEEILVDYTVVKTETEAKLEEAKEALAEANKALETAKTEATKAEAKVKEANDAKTKADKALTDFKPVDEDNLTEEEKAEKAKLEKAVEEAEAKVKEANDAKTKADKAVEAAQAKVKEADDAVKELEGK